MVVQPLAYNFFQTNFPECAEGRLTDLYYTIFEGDGTEYTAKTQAGVVEIGKGSYGVSLSFPEGNYSILWELSNEFSAGDDINAVFFNPDPSFNRPIVKFTV